MVNKSVVVEKEVFGTALVRAGANRPTWHPTDWGALVA